MAEQKFGSKVDIELGTKLMLEVDGIKGKMASYLVGLVPDEYILVKAPSGTPGLNKYFNEGNKITVRYIKYENAYGFEVFITNFITSPKAILALDYPTRIASHSLRKSQRTNCYMLCKVQFDGDEADGVIMDFSKTGCRCIVFNLPAVKAKKLDGENATVQLVFKPPKNESDISINSDVKYFIDYKGSHKLGISFGELEEEQQAIIDSTYDYLDRN